MSEDLLLAARVRLAAIEGAKETERAALDCEMYPYTQKKLVNAVSYMPQLHGEGEPYTGGRADLEQPRLTVDGEPALCADFPLDEACPPNCNCARQLADMERDSAANQWSDEEAEMFKLAFREAPKDFLRIANLVGRSCKDCIAFYYATKATGLYKQVCDVRYWSDLWDAADAARGGSSGGSGSRSDASEEEEVSDEDDDGATDPRSLEQKNARAAGPIFPGGFFTGKWPEGADFWATFSAGSLDADRGFLPPAGGAGGGIFSSASGRSGSGAFGEGGHPGAEPTAAPPPPAGAAGDEVGSSAVQGTNGSGGSVSTSGQSVANASTPGGKRLRTESLSHALPAAQGAVGVAAATVKRHKHSDWLSVNDTPTKQLQHTKAAALAGAPPLPLQPPRLAAPPSMPSPEAQRKMLQNLSLATPFSDDGSGCELIASHPLPPTVRANARITPFGERSPSASGRSSNVDDSLGREGGGGGAGGGSDWKGTDALLFSPQRGNAIMSTMPPAEAGGSGMHDGGREGHGDGCGGAHMDSFFPTASEGSRGGHMPLGLDEDSRRSASNDGWSESFGSLAGAELGALLAAMSGTNPSENAEAADNDNDPGSDGRTEGEAGAAPQAEEGSYFASAYESEGQSVEMRASSDGGS